MWFFVAYGTQPLMEPQLKGMLHEVDSYPLAGLRQHYLNRTRASR